ncbi:MAG: two pore domain potassium channel family protein [Coriobacteriia bacterium]|nr:two pore domain potassium channel family protein [Coriobacteriia bacterium]
MTDVETVKEATEQRQVRDAYGIALTFVLASTLALIASGSPLPSLLVAISGLLQVMALVVTLRVSGYSRRSFNVGTAMVIAVFVVGIIAMRRADHTGHVIGLALWILLALATIATVVRRLATYRRVTLQMVTGLLVVYVLLGVVFGLGYTMASLLDLETFAQGPQGISGSMYFSFVTLATLGYGDITPTSDVVRAAAVAEAILGQLYLVAVVSMAVSRLGTARQRVLPEEKK